MDIAQLSMNMSSARVAQEFNIAMLKKSMDQMEQAGEQIAEMAGDLMIDNALLMSAIDIRI